MTKLSDIKKEDLENLTPEELADLKVKVEELIEELNNMIEECDETLNS